MNPGGRDSLRVLHECMDVAKSSGAVLWLPLLTCKPHSIRGTVLADPTPVIEQPAASCRHQVLRTQEGVERNGKRLFSLMQKL